MPSNLPRFTIRTEENTLRKIKYIAQQYERNPTQEIVYLIKKEIKRYEQEHGEIMIKENDDTNQSNS